MLEAKNSKKGTMWREVDISRRAVPVPTRLP